MSAFDALTKAATAVDNLARMEKGATSMHLSALSEALLEHRGDETADVIDTAGATLGQLETSVNALKAIIRSAGLMDTV